MEYNEVYDFVKKSRENGVRKFRITMKDGTTEEKRLFISSTGSLAYFKPRSSRHGYLEGTYPYWSSIKAVNVNKKSAIEIIRSNLKKLISYTDASGLWPDMNADYRAISKMSDEELKDLEIGTYGSCDSFREKHNITIGSDCLYGLSDNRLIKTINWESYEREDQTTRLRDAIHMHVNSDEKLSIYRESWRKGYDNSVEVNGKRGFYSEEYRGCGNGHYYLLLDERHVMFYGND